MSRQKYSTELKVKISEEYLSGKDSTCMLGNKYGINARTIWEWSKRYKKNGINAFIHKLGCNSYSAEFKTMCVELYISGKMYVRACLEKKNCTKYDIIILVMKDDNKQEEI